MIKIKIIYKQRTISSSKRLVTIVLYIYGLTIHCTNACHISNIGLFKIWVLYIWGVRAKFVCLEYAESFNSFIIDVSNVQS